MESKNIFSCCVIGRNDYTPYLLHKHYAKRIPCITHAYGAYIDNKIYGVCTFGIPSSPNLCVGVCGEEYKNYVLELNRLCVDDNSPFETSRFVGACLRRLNHLFTNGKAIKEGRIIVSYADTGIGHIGKIYQATNFLYTGITKERTDIFTGKHSRHYEKREDGIYEERQIRTAKHRYIYFVGGKIWKNKARKSLKYEVIPYPDGETKRYDASEKIEKQDLLFI